MKTYLTHINLSRFIILGVLSIFLTSAIFHLLLPFIYNSNGPDIATNSLINTIKSILTSGIIIPILETLLFQHLVFIILKKFILDEKSFAITYLTISSLLFALSHYYSLFYIILTFFLGIILTYSYYISHYRKESAFWTTAIIHGSYNTLLIIVSSIFEYYNI